MERQVVALAKGDGFQEVLVALDASADAEYPVVESTGGMWDLGGPLSPWGVASESLALWWPFCVYSYCSHGVHPSAHLIFPCHLHALPMLSLWDVPAVSPECSYSVLCYSQAVLFPLVSTCCTLNIAMVPPQYSHGVPMPFPYHPHGVPVLCLCCPHAIPSIFPFCLHGVPVGCSLDIPILSPYHHPACPHEMSP